MDEYLYFYKYLSLSNSQLFNKRPLEVVEKEERDRSAVQVNQSSFTRKNHESFFNLKKIKQAGVFRSLSCKMINCS